MKNVQLIYRLLLVALMSSLFSSTIYAQTESSETKVVNATLSKDFPIDGELIISNYDAELEIKVWDNPKVEIRSELIVEVNSDEDLLKLIKAFAIKVIKEEKGKLTVDTKFYNSLVSLLGQKTTIELITGEKISVKKIIKVSHTAFIPKGLSLQVSSKYNKLNIENLKGDVKLNLNNVNLTMGDFGASGSFTMKYSKANIGNGGNTTLVLYDTDIDAGTLSDVSVNSKYSKIKIKETSALTVTSYDDDLIVDQIEKIGVTAKYSTFKIGSNAGESKFNLYDSDVFAKGFKSLNFSAKYSDLITENIGSLNIPSSYDNNYQFGILNEIRVSESKYDDFKIEGISNLAEFPNTYDSEISIKNTSVTFKEFSGKFTYGKVYMKLDPSQQFNLNFTSTYGNVVFPSDKFRLKAISDKTDSNRTFEGSTSPDAKCIIKFSTHDTNFTIE